MISHQEAEVLTSARQDSPLDPIVERELQAHLATCDSCRAFAATTERLTAGMRALPNVSASPRIKREVMGRARAGRGPFAGLLGGIGTGFQPGPALAAVALVALIGLFGWIALDRLFFDNGGNDTDQIAAVPTAEVTRVLVASTETPVPTEPIATETTVPSVPTATTALEPTATTAPAPTATTAPEPTATAAPEPTATAIFAPTATIAPEPTATTAPEPTATTAPEPTATTAPEPTATTVPEPTATTAPEPTATTVPEPTATTVPEPTATTAPEPTATTAPEPTTTTAPEPTATTVEESAAQIATDDGPVDLTIATESGENPNETVIVATETPVPTATVAPTETEVPTPTPTEEVVPTATEMPVLEPSPTPGIEPMDGSTSVPVDPGDNANELGVGSAVDTAEISTVPVEPTDNGQIVGDVNPTTTEMTQDGTGGTEEPASIELIAPDGGSATEEVTQESSTEVQRAPGAESSTQPLAEVSEQYSGIVGDPSGQLGLTGDGRLEFVAVPDGASMTTQEGFRLQTADIQPGVVQVCGDGFCEPGMDAPDSEGWQGDVPMGVVDTTAYVLRMYGDRSEVYAVQPQGTALVEANLIAELGPASPPLTVYESGGTLYAWLPSGQWLRISGGSAELLSGSYPDPDNVRFAPSAANGPLIGYFSGGTLIVAPAAAPDAARFSMPSEGIDFDMSPSGDRVATIRGNSIVIFDINGTEQVLYEGGNMQPGSLIWLNSGLVWVDRATGLLYQIPETAP